jgi:hypothetical protein
VSLLALHFRVLIEEASMQTGYADRKVKGDAGYTPNANTAFAIGSWVGATTGAILVAPWGAGCRAHMTAIGTALPTIPLLFGREEPYLPFIGLLFITPLQALGGVMAY